LKSRFTLKINASNVVSFHTTLKKFVDTTINSHHSDREITLFEKLCFKNVFRPHSKTQIQCFQILSSLKSAFEKLRFRDELVWSTIKTKLCFRICLA